MKSAFLPSKGLMCLYDKSVQLDISLVRCAHSWAIELNTRKEIPYLRAYNILYAAFYSARSETRTRQLTMTKSLILYSANTEHAHRVIRLPQVSHSIRTQYRQKIFGFSFLFGKNEFQSHTGFDTGI